MGEYINKHIQMYTNPFECWAIAVKIAIGSNIKRHENIIF